MNHNETVFKRVGWRQLFMTLLNKGWFNQPGLSPFESVCRADFFNAARMISIENAAL